MLSLFPWLLLLKLKWMHYSQRSRGARAAKSSGSPSSSKFQPNRKSSFPHFLQRKKKVKALEILKRNKKNIRKNEDSKLKSENRSGIFVVLFIDQEKGVTEVVRNVFSAFAEV